MQVRDKLGINPELRALTQRKPRDYDPDGKRSGVLQYVRERTGQIINLDEINKTHGWGATTAQNYARKLIKEGRLTREPVPQGFGEGVKYRYHYHQTPVPVSERTLKKDKHGPVITRTDEKLAAEVAEKKANAAHESFVATYKMHMAGYLTENPANAGEHAVGLAHFGRWLEDK